MRYRAIPQTDLSPSVVCLGTAPFGTGIDEVTAHTLLDTFFEHGGNFLDTAHAYGEWVPGGIGLSERVIGKWLKARGVREKIVLATKGAQPLADAPHISRLSRADIVSDLDGSLRDLQVDNVDLYWLHRDDPKRPVADILETLNDQVTQGKIRYFGCSNWHLARIIEAKTYAEEHHIAGFVGNQLLWSYAVANPDAIEDRTLVLMDAATQEFHRTSQMAVMAYTSQGRGFFSKLLQGRDTLPERLRNTYDSEENATRLQRLQHVAQETSLSIPTLVLAYITNQPFPAFPITASQQTAQLLENVQAADAVLSADTISYLEK